MRRRDFLKGLSAVFGAAVLPVAAAASLTSGISTTHYLVDGEFISGAEIDENAFRELRRLLGKARQRTTGMGPPKAAIDSVLYDRVMRIIDSMERITIGQSATDFQGTYGRRPMHLDGIEVFCDLTMEYQGEGHLVSFVETVKNPADYRGGIYGYAWHEMITPATLTARPDSSAASTAPRHPR